jgi:hypothetical protein
LIGHCLFCHVAIIQALMRFCESSDLKYWGAALSFKHVLAMFYKFQC